MLLLTYDISDDKVRTDFSTFIQQYGERVQYSVYKIKNSKDYILIGSGGIS